LACAVDEERYEIDIEALIQAITTNAEFDEFVDDFDFTLWGGAWSDYAGNQRLYYLEQPGKFTYVGYIDHPQAGFRVVYKISDNERLLSDDQIEEWFFVQPHMIL